MADCYLLDQNGVVIDIIDNYIDITWTRRFYTFGEFTMQLKFLKAQIDKLKKGLFIAPQEEAGGFLPDHVYLIEQMQYAIDEEGSLSEVVTISGRGYGGLLAERLVLPTPGQAYDTITAAPAESAIKAYVNRNAAFGASPPRRLPNFFIEPDAGRGIPITYQGRYQVLSDALEEIGRLTEIGWEVFYDTSDRVFRFDILIGEDHGQDGLRPVYFDIDYETVISQDYITSDLGRKTVAYAGGKGDGLGRPIQTIYFGDEPAGIGRRETFVDAQDADDAEAVSERARAALKEKAVPDKFAVMLTKAGAPFKYRRDFDLGDIVAIRNTEWNVLSNVRIIGVENSFEPGAGRRTTRIELAQEFPTLKGRVEEAAKKADAGRRR